MDDRNMLIGRNIRKARQAKNMTQKELAAQIDRTESSIAQYEKGSVEVPRHLLAKMASILSVPLVYFIPLADMNNEDMNALGITRVDDDTFEGIDFHTFLRLFATWEDIPYEELNNKDKLLHHFRKLNNDGQVRAIENVEELTEIPKYQAGKEGRKADGGR